MAKAKKEKKASLEDLVEEIRALLLPGTSLLIHAEVAALAPAIEDEDEDEDTDTDDEDADLDLGGDDEGGDEEEGDDAWKKGDRCQVLIDGEYYQGAVKKLNEDEETLTIEFDDGDTDDYPVDEVETVEAEDEGEFGLEALGLPAKIQEALEENGYATVADVRGALEDGTLDEVEDLTKKAVNKVKQALKDFEG